jgi:hypothetical protein
VLATLFFTMRLILSSRHPRNSTYSTEAGQILYKVDKPTKLTCSVATIRKALNADDDLWRGKLDSKTTIESYYDDNDETLDKDEREKDNKRRSLDSVDAPCADSESENEASIGPGMDGLPVLEDIFSFYAQVEFHTFRSSRFHYNSLDVPVSEFFHKEGWSWYGR